MKKITIEVMTPWEAVRPFIANKELSEEYTKESELFRNMDLSDDASIMEFLDNDACDIRRLNDAQCELLELNFSDGWYVED